MFKNICLIVALIVPSLLYFHCAKTTKRPLFESHALYKIFDLTNVPYERTITSINDAAQKNFLRKPGQERWEMETRFEELRPQLLPLLQQIDFIDQRMPQSTSYDYALFMGALGGRMEKRKQFLESLIQQGVSFKAVIVLVGERPLDAQEEADYFAHGKTEADIADYLFKDFAIPCIIVRTPMLTDQQGVVRRPTTDDTFTTWLATHPTPGSVLVISDNPFIQRQTNVALTALPHTFSVEGAGAAASSDTTMAVYLDELARTLYSMKKNK